MTTESESTKSGKTDENESGWEEEESEDEAERERQLAAQKRRGTRERLRDLGYLPTGHKHVRTVSTAPPIEHKPAHRRIADQLYADHREKVRMAMPKVDTSAPRVRLREILNIQKVHHAQHAQQQIERDNKELLEHITMIMRTHGAIDSQWQEGFFQRSRSDEDRMILADIARQNKIIMDMIDTAVPLVPTVKNCAKRWEYCLEAIRCGCAFPVYWEREAEQRRLHRQHILDDAAYLSTVSSDPDGAIEPGYCFLEIKAIGWSKPLGRLIIQTDRAHCPVASANFHALCIGVDAGKSNEQPLMYKGCEFHRIVENVLCQSGRIGQGGGKSVFGDNLPRDIDQPWLDTNKEGIVCVASCEEGTTGSQFFITGGPLAVLSGKYNPFAEVVQGFNVLRKIMSFGGLHGRPKRLVYISDCGELESWTPPEEDEPEPPIGSESWGGAQKCEKPTKKRRVTMYRKIKAGAAAKDRALLGPKRPGHLTGPMGLTAKEFLGAPKKKKETGPSPVASSSKWAYSFRNMFHAVCNRKGSSAWQTLSVQDNQLLLREAIRHSKNLNGSSKADIQRYLWKMRKYKIPLDALDEALGGEMATGHIFQSERSRLQRYFFEMTRCYYHECQHQVGDQVDDQVDGQVEDQLDDEVDDEEDDEEDDQVDDQV